MMLFYNPTKSAIVKMLLIFKSKTFTTLLFHTKISMTTKTIRRTSKLKKRCAGKRVSGNQELRFFFFFYFLFSFNFNLVWILPVLHPFELTFWVNRNCVSFYFFISIAFGFMPVTYIHRCDKNIDNPYFEVMDVKSLVDWT